jgi:hypothetical protein
MITLSGSKKDNLRLTGNRHSSRLIARDPEEVTVEALKRQEQREKIRAMAERLYNPEKNCHKRGCACGGTEHQEIDKSRSPSPAPHSPFKKYVLKNGKEVTFMQLTQSNSQMKMAKSPFFKKGEGQMDSARMHRSISPDKFGSGQIQADKSSHNARSKGAASVDEYSRGKRDRSNGSQAKSMATIRKQDSATSNYDRKDFNPYFFKEAAGAKSELGSKKSGGNVKMSKEVEDRLFGRTHHQCKTRLCSVFHFGSREKKAPRECKWKSFQ